MTALPLEPHAEAEESTVEKVARAMYAADDSYRRLAAGPNPHETYRRMAVAALAAVRPSPDSEAVDLEAACEPVARQPKSVRRFVARPAAPAAGADPAAGGELREQIVQTVYDELVDHPMWIDNDGRGLEYDPEREARIGVFLEDAADALLSGPLAALVAERDQARAKVRAVEEVVGGLQRLALHHGGQSGESLGKPLRAKHAGMRIAYDAAVQDLRRALGEDGRDE